MHINNVDRGKKKFEKYWEGTLTLKNQLFIWAIAGRWVLSPT